MESMDTILCLLIPIDEQQSWPYKKPQVFELTGSSYKQIIDIFPEILHLANKGDQTGIGFYDYSVSKNRKAVNLTIKKILLSPQSMIIHYERNESGNLKSIELREKISAYLVQTKNFLPKKPCPDCCFFSLDEFANVLANKLPLIEKIDPHPKIDYELDNKRVTLLGTQENQVNDRFMFPKRNIRQFYLNKFFYSSLADGTLYIKGTDYDESESQFKKSQVIIRGADGQIKKVVKWDFFINEVYTRINSSYFITITESTKLHLYNSELDLIFWTELDQTNEGNYFGCVDFSSNGNYIIFEQQNKIFRLDRSGGVNELLLNLPSSDYICGCKILPDDKTVIFIGAKGTFGQIDLETNATNHVFVPIVGFHVSIIRSHSDEFLLADASQIIVYKKDGHVANKIQLNYEERRGTFNAIGPDFLTLAHKRQLSIFTHEGNLVNRIIFHTDIDHVYWANAHLNVVCTNFTYIFDVDIKGLPVAKIEAEDKTPWEQILADAEPIGDGRYLLNSSSQWRPIRTYLFENPADEVLAEIYPFENEQNNIVKVSSITAQSCAELVA